MIIREYRPEDKGAILNFRGRYSQRRADKLVFVENSDTFFCYVAEDKGIKGFIIMEDLRDNNYYMVQVDVSKKRKGIGTLLVKKVFEKIKSGHISLNVNTTNTEAIKFYEALGFTRSGHTKNFKKGKDKYWYEIEI